MEEKDGMDMVKLWVKKGFLKAVRKKEEVEHVRPNVVVDGQKLGEELWEKVERDQRDEEIWEEIDREIEEEIRARDVVDGGDDGKVGGDEMDGEKLAEELWGKAEAEMKETGRKVRVRKAPGSPSVEERRRHEATHANYADWCRHCIRARGRNRPHRRRVRDDQVEKGRVVRVAMDYNFAGEDDEETGKWLTMVESGSGAVWTRVVENKGMNEDTEWVVLQMAEELDSWGYSCLLYTSDAADE